MVAALVDGPIGGLSILTPHIAGLTEEANKRVLDVIAQTVIGYFS